MISYAGERKKSCDTAGITLLSMRDRSQPQNSPRNVEEKIDWQELSWSVTSVFAVSYRPEFNYAH